MKLIEALSNNNFILSFSSGYFGFFAHCGFAKAIESEGLKPSLYTGASSGAIVAACLASGMSAHDMEKEFLKLNKHHYWDPGFGAGFIKGHLFEKTLKDFVSSEMDQTKHPLHVSTFDIAKRKTVIFKQGDLPRIVRASCAIPLMFHPVKIGNRFYWDGGIQDRMAWSGLQDQNHIPILAHSLNLDPVSRLMQINQPTNQKYIFKASKLPPTGPGKFANAAKAIEITYEQTKHFLNTKIT